jgi:hypothetical protein
MKPDWDALGEKYETSKKVLIGDCDCTGSCKATCEKIGVEGCAHLCQTNRAWRRPTGSNDPACALRSGRPDYQVL